MFTKEQAIEYVNAVVKGVPADREDLDLEGNVNQYNFYVANTRRAFSYAHSADLDRILYRELFDEAELRYRIECGLDLEVAYGWDNTARNRNYVLDRIDQNLHYYAARLLETAREF